MSAGAQPIAVTTRVTRNPEGLTYQYTAVSKSEPTYWVTFESESVLRPCEKREVLRALRILVRAQVREQRRRADTRAVPRRGC